MTDVSDKDAVALVLRFVGLQAALIERMLNKTSAHDLEFFTDVGQGHVALDGVRWHYNRHGAGVIFRSVGTVVDAHIGLARYPDGIDGWRLAQYLESIGVDGMAFEGRRVAAEDDRGLDAILAMMKDAGHLREGSFGGRTLYTPNSPTP